MYSVYIAGLLGGLDNYFFLNSKGLPSFHADITQRIWLVERIQTPGGHSFIEGGR